MATKSILIAVPEGDFNALLDTVLEEEGYQVCIAGSLGEAEDVLSNRAFDLIITEAFGQASVFLFSSHFIGVLRRVAPNTPVVLCSKCPSIRHLRRGDYGLAEIIPRPFLVSHFLPTVNALLRTTPGDSQRS